MEDQTSPLDGGSGRSARSLERKDDFDFRAILQLFGRHKFLIVTLIGSAVVAATFEHINFPSYVVKNTIYLQSSDNSPLSQITAKLSGVGMGAEGPREFPEKYIQQIKSFSFFMRAAQQLKAHPEFQKFPEEAFIRKSLLRKWRDKIKRDLLEKQSSRFEAEAVTDEFMAEVMESWTSLGRSGPDALTISVTTPDRSLSLTVANILAELAVKAVSDYELKEVEDAEKYISLQIEDTEKSIRETDHEIVEYKKNNKLFSIEAGATDVGARVVDLKRDLEETIIELEQNRAFAEALRQKNGQDAALELSQRLKYGRQRKIQDVEKEIRFLEIRKNTIKKTLDSLFSSQDPHFEQKVFDLKKRLELDYTIYQELKRELFQIEMQRIIAKNRVRNFEKARDFDVVRSVRYSRKILMAVVLALLIGLPTAYGWELALPMVRSRRALEERNLIYMGAIPDLGKKPQKNLRFHLMRGVGAGTTPICRFDIDSPLALAFKHIRARVLHMADMKAAMKEPSQVIALMSSRLGEGKTFVTVNLAACFGQLGRKILIIDCDMRRASTSEGFQCKQAMGLEEVLAGTVKFGTVVKKGVMPGVDLLPAGLYQSGATEKIAGERFTDLLNDLRAVYDHIFLDTPPLIPPPDAALIARRADLAIIVATYNITTTESLDRATDMLTDMNQKRVYAILNRMPGIMSEYVYVVPTAQTPSKVRGRKDLTL